MINKIHERLKESSTRIIVEQQETFDHGDPIRLSFHVE